MLDSFNCFIYLMLSYTMEENDITGTSSAGNVIQILEQSLRSSFDSGIEDEDCKNMEGNEIESGKFSGATSENIEANDAGDDKNNRFDPELQKAVTHDINN